MASKQFINEAIDHLDQIARSTRYHNVPDEVLDRRGWGAWELPSGTNRYETNLLGDSNRAAIIAGLEEVAGDQFLIDGDTVYFNTQLDVADLLEAFSRQLADYPVIDEEDWSNREMEATHENVIDALRSFSLTENAPLPEELAGDVAQWFSENGLDSELEPRDGGGGYPDEGPLAAALWALGYLDPEDRSSTRLAKWTSGRVNFKITQWNVKGRTWEGATIGYTVDVTIPRGRGQEVVLEIGPIWYTRFMSHNRWRNTVVDAVARVLFHLIYRPINDEDQVVSDVLQENIELDGERLTVNYGPDEGGVVVEYKELRGRHHQVPEMRLVRWNG